MTLRTRLILLHSSLAAFALLATATTIFLVQNQLAGTAQTFDRLVSEAQYVDEARAHLQTLDVHLHEVLIGRRAADEVLAADSRGVAAHLAELGRLWGPDVAQGRDDPIAALSGRLGRELGEFIARARQGDLSQAEQLFKQSMEAETLPACDRALVQLRRAIDARRASASARLVGNDAMILWASLALGVIGTGIVAIGAVIVRRRLIQPIERLSVAADAFARGDLSQRVSLDSGDELAALGGTLNDMAVRLSASQRKYQSLFANLRDGLIVCDAAGVVRECHDGEPPLLGVAARQAVGGRIAEIWAAWQSPDLNWMELTRRGISERGPIRLSNVAVDRNGSRRHFDLTVYSVELEDRPHAAFSLRDVSGRVQLEQVRARAEASEVAVRFARGIAHDFKNLLGAALHALGDGVDNPRVRTAHEACEQAARLARRLMRFATMDAGSAQRVALASAVADIVASLGLERRDDIQVELRLPSDAFAMVDPDHLAQIVLNLITNAVEAMPAGGRLSISAGRDCIRDGEGPTPTGQVALCISDTGVGLSVDAMRHIFEPYYSTKPRGDYGPRGLGLAVTYAAVRHSGGHIRVESEPNKGSTFTVFLPAD